MASIEFIQNRIAGKEKELEKLNKKMDRILQAQATNWEKNPYYYNERDIQYTQRDIDDAQKALQGYRDQLETENKKAASRNIPAIINFLEQWKVRTMEAYKDAFDRYLEALTEWRAYDMEYTEWSNSHHGSEFREERDARYKEYKNVRNRFQKNWNFIMPYVDFNYVEGKRSYSFDEAKFQKVLEQEANAKYDFIVERTCQIVGTITDASNLRVGAKGDLNGFIIGTDGTAKVQTISAEGPIQCFHYRTLIHKMK